MVIRRFKARKQKEEQRQRIVNRLYAQRATTEDPSTRMYLRDMILYAEIGKNRMDLPDDWGLDVPSFNLG